MVLVLTTDERDEANERRLAELEFIQPAYATDEDYVSNGEVSGGAIVRLLLLLVVCSGEDGIDPDVTTIS